MAKSNLISVAEAAKILGVTTVRVRTYISEGRLPAQQIGKIFVINRADVESFERRKTGRPKAS